MTDGTPNPDGLADRPQQEAAEGLIDEGPEPQAEAPIGEGVTEAGARVRGFSKRQEPRWKRRVLA